MTGPSLSDAGPPAESLRASDADREQAVGVLRRGYADGRLASAEFEQRLTAAYGARTCGQLRALTADLPSGIALPQQPATGPDPGLLCLLLCVCPPAGLVYWLVISRRTQRCDGAKD